MPEGQHSLLTPPVGPEDHVRGSRAAAIIVVEYGDFECPYCQAAEVTVDRLRSRLGDELAVAFRHFPRATEHPHAELAAQAAEAAALQERFWEMHDRLFAHPTALDDESLQRHAEALSLDVALFNVDRSSAQVAKRVRHDVHTGTHSGVHRTPTFFINGARHDGDASAQLVEAVVAARETAAGG